MMQLMRHATLERIVFKRDEYMQEVSTWSAVGDIRISISTATGSVSSLNDVLGTSATHTGLTYWRDVVIGDRITCDNRVYMVDYVTTGRPMVLMLKEVRAVGS